MKRAVLGAAALGGAGVGAWRWLSSRRTTARTRRAASRWLVVTVNRRPDEVVPGGRLPEPLARLGDAVEVRVREAPGGRGTELAARPLAPVPTGVTEVLARLGGEDPRQAVRRALRESRCLVETGEVLRADKTVTTRPTPAGRLVDLAVERAGGEGRL
ncbi:hypothetical protein Sme01_48730 [Sphaerisporangium melleum]|uniref:Uncharacterized protein n=1 Tax=Sphaerisporangium melleum TaxID=321316 RepID=A0A917R363_9ACTN|nr:hypothetical protein [Sphaerisporangium melleum]GGK87390.1 hypothetical protein GCM10007964_32410 [Sphaerisporangium melleum]GII72397.1 hypothetical protein Sme01_48730 [Sphaerisporangium melleum]